MLVPARLYYGFHKCDQKMLAPGQRVRDDDLLLNAHVLYGEDASSWAARP
jgi:hypothetical protein